MDVRAQVSMVFHLDKCIGCHTCSIACKNVWTDRPVAEYMWWNNVETKPGAGYPTHWEDQQRFKGGWEHDKKNGLRLRSQGRWDAFLKLFYNPSQPTPRATASRRGLALLASILLTMAATAAGLFGLRHLLLGFAQAMQLEEATEEKEEI